MIQDPVLESLKGLVGRRQVILDPAELLVFEVDAALDRGSPQAVVFAQSLEDVQKVARWAEEHQVPLISRGAGTGLSGGAVAEQGGVILQLSRLKRILEMDTLGRSVTVEPGVVNQTLDEAARRMGLYYPPDPASGRSSTLGGNLAENAGGPHCFKYGVTTNYMTGLEFVLPGGETLTWGGPAFDYPEYDWAGLLTGSEGTLAVVTRIQARLLRLPLGVKTLMAAFDSVESAGAAVSAVIASGLVPAAMEMLDQKIARIIEDYAHPGLPVNAGALLIVEVDGYPESLDTQAEEIAAILRANGGSNLQIARTAEERDRIWFARKSAAGAMARLAPAYLLLDGTVPRSALAQALETTNRICETHGLQVGYVFHAGDGNLHPFILTDPRDPDLMQRAHAAGREFMQAVVALGGSITGEHGVGIEKRPYLSLMYTPAELDVMQEVKRVFDSEGIFNPGKVFPELEDEIPAPDSSASLPDPHFSPYEVEEAAAGLAALSRIGEAVQILGGSPAARPLPAGRTLLTGGLSGVKEFAPHDLYVTAGGGTPVAELEAFLAHTGYQAALLSPWPQATLGGMLAANLNSPLRMRYGGLRDQVLAMTLVLGDGRVIRAGRPVVKNVAGYDLPKVMVGSYGTLGLIAEVTLKIQARPRVQRSLLYPVEDLSRGMEWAQAALGQALVASGIVLARAPELHPERADDSISRRMPPEGASTTLSAQDRIPFDAPYVLAYSAEGLAEDVQAELSGVRAALETLGAPEPSEVEGAAAGELWAGLLASGWGQGLLVRTGLPPVELGHYLAARESRLQTSQFLVDAASGLIYAAAQPQGLGEAQAYLDGLRKPALAAGGYAITLDSPPDWQERLDRWGYQPSTLELMRRLKSRWDPAGILNPGVFLV